MTTSHLYYTSYTGSLLTNASPTILLMVFKCLHNFAPSYLSNLIVKYTPNRALRSSSKNLLVVPPSRTKGYGDRAFSICGPKLWNNLPDSLRHETKLEHFKKNLKTCLF